jgi:predicted  nucleic acid-binding Zn ribbon protein
MTQIGRLRKLRHCPDCGKEWIARGTVTDVHDRCWEILAAHVGHKNPITSAELSRALIARLEGT